MPPDVMPLDSMPRLQPVQSAPTANRANGDRQTIRGKARREVAMWSGDVERPHTPGAMRMPGASTYQPDASRVQSAVDSGADASGDGADVPFSPACPLVRPCIGSSRCALWFFLAAAIISFKRLSWFASEAPGS